MTRPDADGCGRFTRSQLDAVGAVTGGWGRTPPPTGTFSLEAAGGIEPPYGALQAPA